MALPPLDETYRNAWLRITDVAGQLDERGAWVEEGTLDHWGENDSTRQIIASKTFIKNLQTLARCAGAK